MADRRKKKTSYHQYMIYIKTLEEDNIFRTGILTREVDVNYLTTKWDELADNLNNCGYGPTLSTEEWKKRLNDWKNSTRAKYRKIIDQSLTQSDKTLTPLEQKALSLWGTNARKNYPFNDDGVFDLSKLPLVIKSEESEKIITGVDVLCSEEDRHVSSLEYDNLENTPDTDEVNSSPQIEEVIDEMPPKRPKIEEIGELNLPSNIKEVAYKSIKSADLQELISQIKRIADAKEEKLKFEIAKFRFRNPGFKYEYQSDLPPCEGGQ